MRCQVCGIKIHDRLEVVGDYVYCSPECYSLRLTQARIDAESNKRTHRGTVGHEIKGRKPKSSDIPETPYPDTDEDRKFY